MLDLLVYLLRHRDRVVSKDDLIEGVWGGRIVSDSALSSRMTAVRKAIRDSGGEQRLIRTFARKGFRFVGEVQESAAALPEAAAATIGRPAICVLPFLNMGGNPEQEYFADGITEDIITSLSKWRSFMVVARNSAFTYKGRNVDVKQIGRELDVRYVLEGSVRSGGTRLRITAQLVDTGNAAHVWSERYDRELTDMFAVQDDISLHVAAVLEPELSRHEQLRVAAKPAVSLQAWDCLNRGLHLLYLLTREDISAARTLFERAIALEPNLSRAHTSLAYTHQQDMLRGYTTDPAKSVAEQIRHARRGVELDSADSYAHVILSFGYRWVKEYDLAIATVRKAIECNPFDSWAQGTLGLFLDLVGQHREGAAMLERAVALHPRDPHVIHYLPLIARAYLVARDLAAAETWARRAVQHAPTELRAHLVLASVLGHLEQLDEARAALVASESTDSGFIKKYLVWQPYRSDEDTEYFAEGLRKAGWAG